MTIRTHIRTLAATAALLSATALATTASADRNSDEGPLGLHMGMQKSEFSGLDHQGGVYYKVDRLERSNALFDFYYLGFSPKSGLCSITAIGRDVPSSNEGEELREEITMLSRALSNKYGASTESKDEIVSESDYKGRSQWLDAVRVEDREYMSCWFEQDTDSNYPGDVESICVSANALEGGIGYADIRYEFDNFDECSDAEATEDLDSL